MSSRIADRLSNARRRHFMDRSEERGLFRTALRAADLPFLVLFIYGPGGVGKTALLREFTAIAAEEGATVYYQDARNSEPSPDAFVHTLRLTLGLGPDEVPATALANRPGRHVLMLDTYELLTPLDGWLREIFLPQLPETVLVVLAGRNQPSPGWRADPGWQALLRVLSLRNLSSDESQQYLTLRGVPPEQCRAVLHFTHGHPLALSLAAETFAQRADVAFRPDTAPDMIKTLVEQFVQKVPGPAHRAALEACAQVSVLSEALLGEMLRLPDAHELFDWLRGLSFIESGALGLFPHDLAREALVADLRWRHPDWYKELHRRARDFYIKRLGTGRHDEQQRLLYDLIFLHRDNPAVEPFFTWAESGNMVADALREEDKPTLLAMVMRHEGEGAATLAAYWLAHQPAGFLVFRDARQKPAGFMNLIALEQIPAEQRHIDPAVAAAWSHLQRHAPLRAGERATLFRFWMADDSYQAVSPVQSLTFIQAVNHYLTTPGLAFTIFPTAEPDFWAPVLTYADLARLVEADFVVEGRRYGSYGHDWRVTPPVAWLALLGEREVEAGAQAAERAATRRAAEQVIVLSQPDFAAAVRDALHDYVRPYQLRSNPLVRSRLVLERVGDAAAGGDGSATRAVALQALVREAVEGLQVSPRGTKLYRALYHTYVQPAPTQERAAELLDVPFSSYRRHLTTGIAEVIALLWSREVGT